VENLRRVDVEVVNTSHVLPEVPWPSVGVDNDEVGRVAARHLLDIGLRHLAAIGRFPAYSQLRIEGFVAEAQDRGADVRFIDYRTLPQRFVFHPETYGPIAEWLRSLPRPLGLFVTSDYVASICNQACHWAAIAVPEEVAIIGADNHLDLCEAETPQLSSVRINWDQIGWNAAKLLDHLLSGGTAPSERRLIKPDGVQVRGSTDTNAIVDPVVASALGFIRANACNGINATEVVAQVPVSRRTLETRFREQTGRSILEEIHQARLLHARNMLRETDLPIKIVALQSGFNSFGRFRVAFERAEGISPSTYRGARRLR
jgi:LacI family transcriptional regulator